MRVIKNDVERIDSEIRKYPWLDMSLWSFEWPNLRVRGSLSESYPFEIEILFEEVNHLSARSCWHTDTSRKVISEVVDVEFNMQNHIEIGQRTFQIRAEDILVPMRVTARGIELRINKEPAGL